MKEPRNLLLCLIMISIGAVSDLAGGQSPPRPDSAASDHPFVSGVRLADGEDSATIRLLPGGGWYFARVRINGRDAGVFMIDTASSSTLIDRGIAERRQLPVMGLADHDLLPMSRDVGKRIAGIIGMDILSQVPVTLDLAAATMTFHAPEAFVEPAEDLRFNVEVRHGGPGDAYVIGPYVRGKIEGHDAVLLVDTGDGHALHYSDDFAQAHPRLLDGPVDRMNGAIGASRTPIELEERYGRLHVLGRPLERVPMSLRPTRRGDFFGDGAIGTPVLRKFRITIDFAQRRMWGRYQPPKVIAERLAEGLDINEPDLVGRTPLFAAIWDGDAETVEGLISAGADVDHKDNRDHRPLIEAALAGDLEIVQALLSAGADVDFQTPHGKSPLSVAAGRGDLSVVRTLLEAGAAVQRVLTSDSDLNDRGGKHRSTALCFAALSGDVEVTEELLSHGADVHGGDTPPLHAAARSGSLEVVELLLAHGADVDARSRGGMTPLHTAAGSGSRPVVDLLLRHGAEVDARIPTGMYVDVGPDVDIAAQARSAANKSDEVRPLQKTAMMLAAQKGHLDVVERLLKAGAEVDATGASGTTSLMWAAFTGHDDVARALLAAGADPNAADAGSDGSTPLMIAALMLDADTVRLMIDKGGDVHAGNERNQTPLMFAALSGRQEAIVAELIQAGVDVNKRTTTGHTALESAVLRGDLAVVEQLLRAGADVSAVGDRGWTPLMIAAGNGSRSVAEREVGFALPGWTDSSREIVRVLLEHGSDIHARNEDGDRALGLAAKSGHLEVVAALIDSGAEVNAGGAQGLTPLFPAAAGTRAEMVELLLTRGGDVNARSDDHSTPLMAAAAGGDTTVLERLLDEGADVNAADDNGRTALHLAVGLGRLACVRSLLRASADVDATTNSGVSPLMVAVRTQRDQIAQILIDAGADVDAADTAGTTCRQAARLNRDSLIMRLLDKAGKRDAEGG
jgi:ankyrin repeat protein